MYWRITRSQFEKNGNAGNKRAMRSLVRRGSVPGIVLYEAKEPVAWCSVAPREEFASLNRSRVLKPIDDTPVWSIVCFFVRKDRRRQGLLLSLIEAAKHYAAKRGAKTLEAYPSPCKDAKTPAVTSYMGIPEVFEEAGFVTISRPSRAKVVMRCELTGARFARRSRS
jgi:GNAT superfamily N-acetyltransferase